MTSLDKSWYNRFLNAISVKYSDKAQLVEKLINLLGIEREAACRRLRGDVSFSIHEIATISSEWDISLDSIINTNSKKIPFLLYPINYIDPSDEELKFLQSVVQSIEKLPNGEFLDICNKLPRQLVAGYGYGNPFKYRELIKKIDLIILQGNVE